MMVYSNVPYADWVNLKVKLLQEVRYVWDRHFEFEIALSDTEADQLYNLVGQKLFGTRENFDEYYNSSVLSRKTQATVDILVREYLGLEAVETEPFEEEITPVVEEPEPAPVPEPVPISEPEPHALQLIFPLTTISQSDADEYWRIAGIMTGGFSEEYRQDVLAGQADGYFLSDWLLIEELQVLTFTHDGFYFIMK